MLHLPLQTLIGIIQKSMLGVEALNGNNTFPLRGVKAMREWIPPTEDATATLIPKIICSDPPAVKAWTGKITAMGSASLAMRGQNPTLVFLELALMMMRCFDKLEVEAWRDLINYALHVVEASKGETFHFFRHAVEVLKDRIRRRSRAGNSRKDRP
jgi:hypothetical protein